LVPSCGQANISVDFPVQSGISLKSKHRLSLGKSLPTLASILIERWQMLYRFFAVLLITLAASPFTAPFSSCDLTAVDVLHHASESVSAAKAIQEAPAIPSLGSGSLTIRAIESLHLRAAVFYSQISRPQQLVLRL
jgi:hypothetical protein